MNVVVIGGGAVGTLLAWALANAGRDVTLVSRRAGTATPPDRLTIVDPDGARRTAGLAVVPSTADVAGGADAILFAVKMFDLEAALGATAAWPDALTLTVLNGIGAEDLAARSRPTAPIVAGSLTAAVEPLADGAVAWVRRGGLGLAAARGDATAAATTLAASFGMSGLRTRLLPDAAAMKWSKLLGNLVGNATAAILDMDVGTIYRHPALFEVERDQLREASAVMRAQGLRPVGLPGADVRMLIRALELPNLLSRRVLGQVLGGARGGKDPSLLIHVRTRGGRSEVAWLNGAVVTAGERLGIPTPINAGLTRLVDAVSTDPERREWFRHRPERLLAAL